MVRNVSSTKPRFPATSANRYDGFGNGSCQTAKCRPPGSSPEVDEVAVGQQHRRFGFVGLDARGVDRHHVGPVREIGDAAKAFRLALRAIGVRRSDRGPSTGYWPTGRSRSRSRAGTAAAAAARWSGGRAWRRSVRAPAARRRASSAASVSPSPSSTSGAGAAAFGLGLSCRVARTRDAVGWSETSSATVSTSQSGGR